MESEGTVRRDFNGSKESRTRKRYCAEQDCDVVVLSNAFEIVTGVLNGCGLCHSHRDIMFRVGQGIHFHIGRHEGNENDRKGRKELCQF
jgi:hypothetical protein